MNMPARKLKKSAVKNIVRFPSRKSNGGKPILVESILESHFCLHLEFDSSVSTYFPQPCTFDIDVNGELRKYTPDFEVHYTSNKRKYIEVKPCRKTKNQHYVDLFSAFEAHLENSDASFEVVDESYINAEPILHNYKQLYRYRKTQVNMSRLHQCADLIDGPIALNDLIKKLHSKVSLHEIYGWLAQGYLQFDINSEYLSMKMRIVFSVD